MYAEVKVKVKWKLCLAGFWEYLKRRLFFQFIRVLGKWVHSEGVENNFLA